MSSVITKIHLVCYYCNTSPILKKIIIISTINSISLLLIKYLYLSTIKTQFFNGAL